MWTKNNGQLQILCSSIPLVPTLGLASRIHILPNDTHLMTKMEVNIIVESIVSIGLTHDTGSSQRLSFVFFSEPIQCLDMVSQSLEIILASIQASGFQQESFDKNAAPLFVAPNTQ